MTASSGRARYALGLVPLGHTLTYRCEKCGKTSDIPDAYDFVWSGMVIATTLVVLWHTVSLNEREKNENFILVMGAILAFFAIDSAIGMYRRIRFPKA
jgi:hypothetical protein